LIQADEGAGEWRQLQAPLSVIPILLRGGHIIPTQAANLTTADRYILFKLKLRIVFPLLIFCSRKNPVELLVIPNNEGAASGYMYWDDGDSLSKTYHFF
jgi:lysosomal alpha-glucosidase